ncbi:component of the polarisome [Globomyces sp. JEL0801]|nr:component of the polarisome [Globomyces sp. JEL0801]
MPTDQEQLAAHYALLRDYLESYFASGQGQGLATAMARINRLPIEQFLDVSNDLNDELNRRLNDSKDVPFLPIRNDLAPKRNQARQKMATLQEPKFKDLAAQLYLEIERRFPTIASDYNSRYGERERNTAASEPSGRRRREPSQDNYRPSRSTRENSREPRSRRPSQEASSRSDNNDEVISQLRSDYEFKIAMLEKQVKESEMMNQDSKQLRKDYEKLELDYNQLNKQSRKDYEKLELDYNQLKKDLKSAEASKNSNEKNFIQLQNDYDLLLDDFKREQKNKIAKDAELKLVALDRSNNELRDDLAETRRTLDSIKKESQDLLEDVQALTTQLKASDSQRAALQNTMDLLKTDMQKNTGDASALKAEKVELEKLVAKLKAENVNLETELKKSKENAYIPPKTASIRSSKTVLSPKMLSPTPSPQPLPNPLTNGKSDEDRIEDYYIEYENNTNDLINTAKIDPKGVLTKMKQILLTCKKITQECEVMEDDPKIANADKDAIVDVKDRLSENLQILMEATKNHAKSGSSKTSKIIEDEVGLLTDSVADIVDLLKDILVNMKPAESFGNKETLSRSSKRDTVRSFAQPKNGDELPPMNLPELQGYLGDQIDSIAHTIQKLLQAMKDPGATGDELLDYINKVATNVDNIIYETQGTLDTSPEISDQVANEADEIALILSDIRNEFLDLGDIIYDAPNDKTTKQKLANSSYEMAKQAKELLAILKY